MIGPEDETIELKEFNGIWARGNPDEVPQDHLIDCLNLSLVSKGKAITRFPLNEYYGIGIANGKVAAFFQSSVKPSPIAEDANVLLNWILMDSLGNIYINNSSIPILQTGCTDFAALNLFNRTFISPNFGSRAIWGQFVQIYYYYNGSYILRNAAGLAPYEFAIDFSASQTTNAGDIPAGVHQFAVIYQTDTGFQTPPGPLLELVVTSGNIAPGNPTVLTYPAGHGLITGDIVDITGGTGPSWTEINSYWSVTVLTPTTFSIPLDSSAFGSSGTSVNVFGTFTPATLNCDGVHTVSLSNVSIGPSYVVQRIILATQAGGTEFFFIPNGIISDNTTTTFEIDFFDTDLVISADYLFDLMPAIPAGTGLCQYNGRLVIVGAYFYDQTALISNVSDPESISTVTGYSAVPIQNDNNPVIACAVLRDILYLIKFVGLYNSQDNGGDPSTWPVVITDLVVGSYQKGLCGFRTTLSGAADTGDILLLSSKEGIYIFDGTVRRPELTFKIQDIWSSIPLSYGNGGFCNVQVCQSVWTHQLFIAYPSTPTSVYADALLVGDYDPIPGVLDPIGIRWSRYSFPVTPTAIKTSDTLYVASVQSNPGYLFQLGNVLGNDFGPAAISEYLTTYLAYKNPGWVHFFKAFRLRINATGTVTVTLYGEDNVLTENTPVPGNIINTLAGMTQPAGKEFLQLINFVNEKMAMKIGTNALGANMNLNRVEIFCIPRWQVRPG